MFTNDTNAIQMVFPAVKLQNMPTIQTIITTITLSDVAKFIFLRILISLYHDVIFKIFWRQWYVFQPIGPHLSFLNASCDYLNPQQTHPFLINKQKNTQKDCRPSYVSIISAPKKLVIHSHMMSGLVIGITIFVIFKILQIPRNVNHPSSKGCFSRYGLR